MLFLCKKVALFLKNTGGVYSVCVFICTNTCTCVFVHVMCYMYVVCELACVLCVSEYVCVHVGLCVLCAVCVLYVSVYLDGVGRIGRE